MTNARDKANNPQLNFTSKGIDDNADAVAITIDSSENVLIKTTDIGYSGFGDDLTIGSASGNNGMTLRSGTSNYGTFYFSDATGTGTGTYAGKLQYNHSDNSMRIATNSVDRLAIDSAGNVGIGEFVPLGKMHIKSSDSGASVNSVADELVLENSSRSGMTILSGTSSIGTIAFGDSGSNTIGSINYDHSSNNLNFYTNGSEAMRIDSSGKVGIGTTSPNSMFEVRDNASPTIRVTDGDANNITHMQADGANGGYFGTLTSHDVRIAPNNSTKLIVKVDGKVGIGTASPSTTLDVAGDTTITKNDTPLYLNRTSADGEVLRFSKDGTARGSINTGNGSLHITEATYGGIAFSSIGAGDINPCNPNGTARDNAMSLGQPSARFKDLYLSQGAFIGGTGTANQLDDYEEGTWTPTNLNGSVAVATTHKAIYVKIGNIVHVFCDITYASSPADTSQANALSGIPFSCSDDYYMCGSKFAGVNESVQANVASTSAVFRNMDDGVLLTRSQLASNRAQHYFTYTIS